MWFLLGQMALQAFSSFQAGQAQARDERQNEAISRHNAMLSERDAQAAEIRTDEDQMLALLESEQAKGSLRVRQGASGAATGVGAPFKIRAQFGSLQDFQNFRIGREGRATVEDFRQEGAASRFKAHQFGERAKSAEKAGALGAGTAILGGLATGTQQGYWFQPKSTNTATTSGSRRTGTFRGL